MKTILSTCSLIMIIGLFTFAACVGDDEETAQEVAQKLLQNKQWTVVSVVSPIGTATEDSQWIDFKVSFTATEMTTFDHPDGAEAVWPSGAYTLSEDGKTITRTSDGVEMLILEFNETTFNSTFTVAPGTNAKNAGGRLMELGGDYIFNMK